MVITDPFLPGDVLCQKCGTYNKNTPDFCNKCGDPVSLQLKYDQQECEERGMTFSAPLKVTVRLTIYDKDAETGNKTIRDIKEQEVFFGDIPLMTPNGTFIVNGTERVIVSQLHRSPGVFFETANNHTYFLGKIIPYRGSWVEFEYDQKNTLYVRIDRKRKFLGTIFLRALGLRSDEEILKTFYTVDRLLIEDGKLQWAMPQETLVGTHLLGAKPAHAVVVNGEEIAHSGRKITPHTLKAIRAAGIEKIEVEAAELDGALTAADVVDMATGEVVVESNVEVTADRLHKILSSGAASFEVFFPERDDVGNIITNTLKRDSIRKPEEALIEIYRKLRPGDPPTLDTATALFEGMFFDARKYDFSRVGRLKFNIKLFENQDATHLDHRTLTPDDFAQVAQEHRHGGRHRPPGQSPRARRGRTDGESVPHRPGAHGARHQGKDERVPGTVDGHAARPHQRQAGDGGHSRILRFVAVVAVHGSDQSAVGDYAQAASVGPWTRRLVA
jgi:DNA-directed RNA polymerase subunit beta